jgi:hypothetical protein
LNKWEVYAPVGIYEESYLIVTLTGTQNNWELIQRGIYLWMKNGTTPYIMIWMNGYSPKCTYKLNYM